ncbi:LysR family transcriptional regulator [Parasphingorhabdus sp.]|uniref:LysR family transcriptional regulator n=1 Tax=Parasphingorhabdus sp. TaxID=2709688 RepID=UPI003A957C5D
MDIVVARTFLEVVKTGSFVNAATNLNLTQTAISARIRVLEEQLDRPLFVRSKAGAKLTPAGENFFRFATTLVKVWESAQRAVALPPGRDTVVSVGAELSLWSPLLRHFLLGMRRECPEIAMRIRIEQSEQLIEQVQDGSLDVAVVYAAPHRPGLIAELLFEEKLVHVRTTPIDQDLTPEDYIEIDWGEEFAASYRSAFPDMPNAVVSVSYGPLALDYLLATGGSGYFRKGSVQPHLEEGRLALLPDSPQFSYSAYVVHSSTANMEVMARIRRGLRIASEISR